MILLKATLIIVTITNYVFLSEFPTFQIVFMKIFKFFMEDQIRNLAIIKTGTEVILEMNRMTYSLHQAQLKQIIQGFLFMCSEHTTPYQPISSSHSN